MNYIIDPPPQVSVAVRGSDARFPVRRVYCVGRNYEAHAREMGKDPTREPPFMFQKPADAVIEGGSVIAYPPQTGNFHHEIELVVAIARGGRNIGVDRANEHVFGYAGAIVFDAQLAAQMVGLGLNHNGLAGAGALNGVF